ncbi:MAG: anti-sigma factor [Aquihabitans sp.]
MGEYHDDFTDLLGAYALDAIDADEAELMADHLRTCPWCAGEVAEHREVASFLSQTGADAPPGIWDRISFELSPAAPPMRMALTRPDAEQATEPVGSTQPNAATATPATAPTSDRGDVVSLDKSRSARSAGRTQSRSRTMLAVLAVAACLVVALGVVVVNQNRRIDDLQQVAQQLPRPGTGDLSVKLTSPSSERTARAIVSADGQGYLVVDDLPAPGPGDVYQVWGQVDGTMLSLGTFGDGRDVVRFQVDPANIDGVKAFAITKEKAPGVITSTQAPVVVGAVI